MKKILSFILIIFILLSVTIIPTSAAVDIYRYSYFQYYKVDGGISLYRCDTTAPAGTKIPSKIDGYTVVEIAPLAFSSNKNLVEITVPDTVKKIGLSAFSDCKALKKVTIPDSVTFMDTSVFSGSAVLTTVILPSGLTSIGDRMFYNCSSLTDVTIPQGVTSIGDYAFYYCTSLPSINIPSSVKEIKGWAFRNCNALTKVNISNLKNWCEIEFDRVEGNPLNYAKNLYLNDILVTDLSLGSDITTIKDYAFCNCKSITSVDLDNVNLSYIGQQVFYSCSNITSFNISDLEQWCKTELVGVYANPSTYSKSIKLNGKLITNLEIPYRISKVAPYAFYGANITSLKVPFRVKEIGDLAFSNCSSLSTIEIHDDLKIIGDSAFYGCNSLTTIDLPENLDILGEQVFNNCSNLTSIDLGSNIREIGEYAFKNCTSLKSFTAPDTLEKIGTGAFYGCTSLENASLSQALKTIEYGAFEDCTNLKNISNIENVEEIGQYAFERCSSLESLDEMPNLKKINKYAFSYCESLKEFTFPDGIKIIEGHAFGNSGLENAVLPDSIDKIGALALDNTPYFDNIESTATGIVYNGKHVIYVYTGLSGAVSVKSGTKTIAYQAFANCTSITKITLPQTLISIGGYAFFNCKDLTQLSIPASVEYIGAGILNLSGIYNNASNWSSDILYVSNRLICAKTTLSGERTLRSGTVSIAEEAFKNCTSLTGITICEGIKTLPKSVFEGCDGLTYVTLPNSLERIEYNAFKDFSIYSMSSIYIPKNVKYLDNEYMGYIQWDSYKPTIICHTNSLAEKHAIENRYPIQLADSVKNISINTLPNKTEYNTGDVLDTKGLTIKAVLSDWSEEIVSDNFTVEECDMSTAGEKTVTVNYKDFKTSFNITVTEPKYPESQHSYCNNTDKMWTYTSPISCTALKVTFSEDTVLEDNWDWIYFYDELGNIIREYTGNSLAGKTVTVSGDALRLRMLTDYNYTENGFKITNIRPVDPSIKYGDLDNNNLVNSVDVSALRRLILGKDTFTDISEIISDLNGDGNTNLTDLVRLKKFCAGINVKLG